MNEYYEYYYEDSEPSYVFTSSKLLAFLLRFASLISNPNI